MAFIPLKYLQTAISTLLAVALASSGIFALDYQSLMGGSQPSEYTQQSPLEHAPYISDGVINDTTYIVGPGDVFQIFVESVVMDKQVNAEGNIIIRNLGPVSVEGLILKEAKARILQMVQKANIKSQCYVNLSRPKHILVTVTGAVKTPGIYSIQGTYRLVHLLTVAGWFSQSAQQGDIKIISRYGQERWVNIKNFFIDGDLESNPLMEQGARIHVPFLDYGKPVVSVQSDDLLRDVQLTPGESAQEIISKFFLFLNVPFIAQLIIQEQGREPEIISYRQSASYKPGPGAKIEVSLNKSLVYVGGAVRAPGFTPYHSSKTILQYISQTGLSSESKITRRIKVVRANGDKVKVPIHSTDISPGDMIMVSENMQKKFIIYTPVLLSFASLSIAIITIFR